MSDVYLWETKTTSESLELGGTFWKRTILDPQLSLYLPALRAMGYQPRGCIYDALRKPAQRPSAKGETPENYRKRCLLAIGECPDRFYARREVPRLDADEREAAADVWNTAVQMREAKRLSVYPRNPDSCVQWSRECDYLSVCASMANIGDPVLFRDGEQHEELEGDTKGLLTQSALRCYRSCPRKFQYRYLMRRRPLKSAETLSTGKSTHAALDVFRRTSGDLDAARAALLTEDLFVRAKEEAMLIGYAAHWGAPVGVIAIEKQFRIPLSNPLTDGVSRTFELGGKVDAIVEGDLSDLLNVREELAWPSI